MKPERWRFYGLAVLSKGGNWVEFSAYEQLEKERDQAVYNEKVRADHERIEFARAEAAEAKLGELRAYVDQIPYPEEWEDLVAEYAALRAGVEAEVERIKDLAPIADFYERERVALSLRALADRLSALLEPPSGDEEPKGEER